MKIIFFDSFIIFPRVYIINSKLYLAIIEEIITEHVL